MSNNNKQNLLTRADSAVIPQQKLLGLLQLIRLPPPQRAHHARVANQAG